MSLTPDRGEVHVWQAALDVPGSRLKDLELLLSADELARANRFRFRKDRQHFVVARGVLRGILGRYLGFPPETVQFRYGVAGKPALAEPFGDELRFNLAHSFGLSLYAITRSREVGVDLEWIRDDFDGLAIAERFFSQQEVVTLRALPADQQPRAFFACWTRKEAYLKARGEGLSLALDQFDVSLAPDESAALLSTRDDPAEAARWSLHALELAPGFVAALAVEGQIQRLRCWHWPAS